MLRNRFHVGTFMQLTMVSCLACADQAIKTTSESWRMHIIDNKSFGSDGTKVYDVNKDGYPDIICGWEQGNVARLYINPGKHEDWPYIEVPAPSVEDAIVMDLDMDGFSDIVTFSEGTHKRMTIHWAPSGGDYMDSNLWKSEDIPCTVGVTQWMFGRPMNVDDKNGLDIIVAAKNEGAIVGWLESPNDPRDMETWKLHTIAPASWVMSVEILDINHDGQQDILVSDRSNKTNGVKWFQHPGINAANLYDEWTEHLIGMQDRDPMFLDCQRSIATGLLEIWVPDLRKELFHFVQVDSLGLEWQSEHMLFPERSGLIGKSAAVGDIDGDSHKDLVTTYDGAEDRLGVMWSKFDTKENKWVHHDVSGELGNKYDFAYLMDMDRDGDLDILTSEENNNSSTVAGLGVIWYENPLSR